MKIAMERNHLLKALGHVQRVVENRTTYPILSNVLLRASEGVLELRATDLDIEVTERVPASVLTEGTTTVSAHKLYDIIRKLADGAEIRLEKTSENDMTLTSGRSRFNLPILSAESFPDLKSGTFTSAFDIPAPSLLELIERTAFAASTEETRYYLNGIYLHGTDAGNGPILRAVATDGHRMARTDIDAPEGSAGMEGIIIPSKTVKELGKLVEGIADDVRVEVSDTKIRVTVGEVVILSKLIEGTFPDYDRVTPKNNQKRLQANKAEFAMAVDRVSTIASDRGGRSVKLSVSDGVLELIVSNPDHGEAREEMPIAFSESEFAIGFNSRYLMDVIGQIKSENAIFMLHDANSPSVIHEDGDGRALYVLMPMRT